MPKLWRDTIEAHRREVRDAILDAAAALVAEHGPLSVTMSRIAEETGIGRATLYKYFPDVEAVLAAWHGRHVTRHLAHLAEVRDRAGDPGERLRAVLEAYARIHAERARHHREGPYGAELAARLHQGEDVARVQQQLHRFVGDLLAEASVTGYVRDDVPAGELASYCLHALGAAGDLPSAAAVRRLVDVTLAALRRQPT